MQAHLSLLLQVSVYMFAATSMLSVGLRYSVKEIIDPLRNWRLALKVLLANFLLVPLITYVVANALSLEPAFKIGLLLLTTAAGAPFLIKLTKAAGGDVALSAALLVLLLLFTIFYMPIVVPLELPHIRMNPSTIAISLFSSLLLPLAIGHAIEALKPNLATRLFPVMSRASGLFLVALLILTVVVNFRSILGVFGTGAILAALLIAIGAFVIGYLLGGPDQDQRRVVGLATAQRNIAAATVVASQDFDDPNILTMIVVMTLVGIAVLFPIAWVIKKRGGSGRKEEEAQ